MRRPTKPTTLPIGVISEGTLRPEDLIPAYLSVLEDIRLTKDDRREVSKIRRDFDAWDPDSEESTDVDLDNDPSVLVDELQTIAERYAPDYAYVGSLEGDGACFGVWASLEQVEDDCRSHDGYVDPHDPRMRDQQVTKIDAGDDRAGILTPYVLEVSDHGNATLYRRAGRAWKEVWSIV